MLLGAGVGAIVLAVALQRLAPLATPRPALTGRLKRNIALSLLVLVAGGLAGALMVAPATYAEDHDFGLLRALGTPPPVAALVGVLALEFVFYWLHRIEHTSPLWRIHRTHHTDLDLDVSTSIRSHPLDVVLTNLAFGALVVLPLGLSPTFVAAYNLCGFAAVWLQHARTDLPAVIERPLSLLLVTPAFHRMHHSDRQAETDSNYGNMLSVYDRLFGTFTPARTDLVFGIDAADVTSRQSIGAMLAEPLHA